MSAWRAWCAAALAPVAAAAPTHAWAAEAKYEEKSARSIGDVLLHPPQDTDQWKKEWKPEWEAMRRPTAVTVAGGVSLGAYQAGFLYYYTRFLQEYAARYEEVRKGNARAPALEPPLQVVTGASAGSINAFLAALTACSAPVKRPEQSPFWSVWMGVGMAQLRANRDTKGSLLTDKGRETVAEQLKDLWKKPSVWSDANCRVQVGISATRLTARMVQIGPLTSNSRLTEKFVFEVTKDGAGAPRFGNLKIPREFNSLFYPQLGWTDDPELPDVTDLLLASSAFPLAFPAHLLRYQLLEPGSPLPSKQSGLFIDGGVLDNQPVKLARTLLQWRPRPVSTNEKEGSGLSGPATAVNQVYVDTSAVDYGASNLPEAPIVDATAVTRYGRFLRDYLSAAGQSEFLDANEDALFAQTLAVPQRTLPVAGEHLMHFAAFAEEAFRENDFFVGMVDASQFLARSSRQFQMLKATPRPGDGATATPEPDDPVPIESATYQCYRRRMLSGRGEEGCKGVDERLLKVLRVCLELRTRILLGDHRADLSDVFFDELYESGFTYNDLAKGRRLRAREVRSELRDVVEEGIAALARSDDLMPRYVIQSVGRELANASLLHRGPHRFWALGTSNRRGFDVTYSPMLIADRWRPSIALQLFNIDVQSIQYAPGSDAVLAPSRPGQRSIENKPNFGINIGLHPRMTYSVPLGAVVQLEFGAGYVGAIRLTSDWTNSFVWLRHGPVASFTVLGFERLYADLSFVRYLDGMSVIADAYQRPDIIPVVTRRTFDMLFGAGWRFY